MQGSTGGLWEVSLQGGQGVISASHLSPQQQSQIMRFLCDQRGNSTMWHVPTFENFSQRAIWSGCRVHPKQHMQEGNARALPALGLKCTMHSNRSWCILALKTSRAFNQRSRRGRHGVIFKEGHPQGKKGRTILFLTLNSSHDKPKCSHVSRASFPLWVGCSGVMNPCRFQQWFHDA